MRLRLSRLAIEDLTLIHDYTVGEWGEEQALNYVHALWDALERSCLMQHRRLQHQDFTPAVVGGTAGTVYARHRFSRDHETREVVRGLSV
ncbi:MAG: type II toxin-antitoxin system RelE/ParE family toxin [Chthoniobacteraceae bacterium]